MDGRSRRRASSPWPTCSGVSPARWTRSCRAGGARRRADARRIRTVLRGRRAHRSAGGRGADARLGHRWPVRARPRRHRCGVGGRRPCSCSSATPTTRRAASSDQDELTAARRAIVDRHGARVIADEVHAPPRSSRCTTHLPYASVNDVASAHHAVTITSASKTFNIAGLKCAQVVASNHDDASRDGGKPADLPGARTNTPRHRGVDRRIPQRPDVARGPAGLELDAQPRHVLGDLIAAELPGVVRTAPPEATFLSWIDCSSARPRRSGRPLPAATATSPSAMAHRSAAGVSQYVRLNFGTSPELLERIVWGHGSASLR